jgi:hypothetical protein
MEAGKWAGFRCSLDASDVARRERVEEALENSGRELLASLNAVDTFTDHQNQLMMDLLEHEAQHHGQLIRYLYGLRLPVPAGWKARYALD